MPETPDQPRRGVALPCPNSPALEEQMIRTRGLTRHFRVKGETVQAVRGLDLDVAPGRAGRLPRPERRRQVDHPAHAHHPARRPPPARATVAGHDVPPTRPASAATIGYVGQGNGAGHSQRVARRAGHPGPRATGSPARRPPPGRRAARRLDLDRAGDRQGRRRCPAVSAAGSTSRSGWCTAPRLLFLDEPSTGLDPQNRANLWEHILRLRGRARHDDLADHPLPGRGRHDGRPGRGHRPRPGDRRRHRRTG